MENRFLLAPTKMIFNDKLKHYMQAVSEDVSLSASTGEDLWATWLADKQPVDEFDSEESRMKGQPVQVGGTGEQEFQKTCRLEIQMGAYLPTTLIPSELLPWVNHYCLSLQSQVYY